MMKFNHLKEFATIDGIPVHYDGSTENGTWVRDSEGIYSILDIDWEDKEIHVAEIGYNDEESDDYDVLGYYYRTFSEMKKCHS